LFCNPVRLFRGPYHRRTGGPAVKIEKINGEENYLDRKQLAKLKKQKDRNSLFEKILGGNHGYPEEAFALEPEYLLADNDRGWIAIVHADGNSLGQTIQKITAKVAKEHLGTDRLQKMLKTFSENLDRATRQSAQDAFNAIVRPVYEKENIKGKAKLPLRPVILGGDDLTLIIRGELAIPFTQEFLRKFSHHTKNNFGELVANYNLKELQDGLSACAGIAFIKPSYPFHYGVDLSESLCTYAKANAKSVPNQIDVPSCLVFHRVQSAFVEDYQAIISKELTTKDGVQLSFGPYYIDPQPGRSTVKQLLRQVHAVQEAEAPKAPIREWLTTLATNRQKANQLMERIIQLNRSYVGRLDLENALKNKEGDTETHLHDVIMLDSIGKIDKAWTK
jgi:hypothetical protein